MTFLLNKSDMASSIGISVQAFDKWGVPPVERRGREVFYDVKTVLEIDRERQQENLTSSDGENSLEGRLLQARIDLTEEQAVAQKLKNKTTEGKLIDSEFCIFALSKLAMALSSTLDSIPLSMQRQFPDLTPRHIDHLKTLIAKGANQCARAGDKLPDLLDEYIRTTTE
ncbi:terminase small subunit [Escherichia coli]|uniref:terminase small subunit n=1 Tax=Escherichia coli TaxID=562 RepID=UPI001F0F9096|nr:terminase small subunit [Escherichia coli]UMR98613.1 DNA-packaging protein [Escherichia coli]